MRKLPYTALAAAAFACVSFAADWPTAGGSPQRDNWARTETAFTKENASKIELLYKFKAENQVRGNNSLTSPIVNGFMITHLGFKEMMAFAGSGDNVYSIDADLNRLSWKVHFDYKAAKPQVTASTPLCPGGLTTSLAMPGSSTLVATRGGGGVRGAVPQLLSLGNFGRAANFAIVSTDGNLHILNSSTGSERTAPIAFVPPNAKLSALNTLNNSIYVATQDGCGGNPNAIYGLDLTPETHTPVVFETGGASPAGSGGTAIAADGTVYAQLPDGKGEVAGTYNDTVIAFSPDLKVKDYFTPNGPAAAAASSGITPVLFTSKGRDYVVAGGRDGRLHLLDAKALGGPDHHTSLFSTLPAPGTAWQGTFASWEGEKDGPRWVYATTTNSVIAYQLEILDGKPALTQKWKSKELAAPAPVVTANGLVFVLATGQPVRGKNGTRAVLSVLDGETGTELYSSGSLVTTWSSAGLAVANRRIYFTTHDNQVYSLGFLSEQPQLTGK